MNTVKNYQEAVDWLYSYAPERGPKMVGGFIGLERTKYLLKLLANPQEKIPVIHVAGTSGKGSTSYLISLLLTTLGFKTGLHVGPHLLDLRERVQINNGLLKEYLFVKYLNQIIPVIEKMKNSQYGQPTYFEIMTSFAFYVFYMEKCDYAVMETGMGGLLDATNTVKNPKKLAVITRIGLDHMALLGQTLTEIAKQKAGIIQVKNIVITLDQSSKINKVFKDTAELKNALLNVLRKGVNFKNISFKEDKTVFDFEFENVRNQIKLGLIGEYQAENCSLALASIKTLSKRDGFEINWPKALKTLEGASFPGRFQILNLNGKKIILDGAHNGQKMSSFISSLNKVIPGKVDFLISFKEGKDYLDMLKIITPKAKNIYVTSFALAGNDLKNYHSEGVEVIAKLLKKMGFEQYQAIEDQDLALTTALSSKSELVITGSLYFISNVYPKLKS